MGGVETHCEQLYTRIAAACPELRVTVIARREYVDPAVRSFAGVAIYPIWNTCNPYLEAITHTVAGLFHARFKLRADIVHVHAIGPGLAIPLAKLLALKVVFTHHGEDYQRAKWNGVARLALRAGEIVATSLADRVIAVSRSVAAKLVAGRPASADRVSFIPNAAALPPDTPGSRDVLSRFDLTPGRYVVSVGRLVPEKGFDTLIDAFEEAGGDRKLVIVGGAQTPTPYAEGLLRRASERVVFTGQQNQAEVAALLRHAGLFVLASTHEGLPIAALEAIAAGARVLVSDIAPNRDLDLPPENYFPAGDARALACRLRQPETVPAIDVDSFRTRYDWDAIAASTAAVFRDLAGTADDGEAAVRQSARSARPLMDRETAR
jgi:glycosyltransferase involved in cell wall biosynthesis